jgi:Flp pilus assembly protein TadG
VRSPVGAAGGERGSAAVDFVLVGALVTVLVAGVLQLALGLHVRATLIDCAAEGARFGALLSSSPEQGAQRARELIAGALSPAYARDVEPALTSVGGVPVLEVRVRAPLPVLGLLGPSGFIDVAGRSVVEG